MALELKDLTENERLALVALLKLVAEADKYVTDPEAKQVRKIIAALGTKAYQAAMDEADRRFEDPEELRRFLQTIDRQEARELIYATLLEVALADAPLRPEIEILQWLERVWHVKARVVEPEPKGTHHQKH
ncbi:MAG: TerB family tellurite resistance protein [Candidatus Binatia bacterium]